MNNKIFPNSLLLNFISFKNGFLKGVFFIFDILALLFLLIISLGCILIFHNGKIMNNNIYINLIQQDCLDISSQAIFNYLIESSEEKNLLLLIILGLNIFLFFFGFGLLINNYKFKKLSENITEINKNEK